MSLLEVVEAVRAVELYRAVQRIPEEYKTSFFGAYDIWHYIPIFDRKLCDRCLMHAETEYFVGRHLRGLFPYLKIKDENTIEVNEHLNCRCKVSRITDPHEYLVVTRDLF